MLWQNEPSIIIGKHQNTFAEINYQYVKKYNIPVVRRISGGGTVFHDLGNLNFSFIENGEKGKLVDFKKFTKPIVEVLNQMGVPAIFEGKNDLRVNGLKISGNAEHVYKNKVLHHGTLLFSSDLSGLNKAIKVVSDKYEDKAVKSIRSKVANISDFLKPPLRIEDFRERIFQHIINIYKDVTFYSLNKNDDKAVRQLVIKKYSTWKWNFGYSPKYSLHRQIQTENGILKFNLKVEKGFIKDLEISGLKIKPYLINRIETTLKGRPYEETSVKGSLLQINNDLNNTELSIDDIVNGLF
ncbi:MAG: hypothetical protein B6D61_08380 [Bacteroidetes bacterium 4484_249]|nr:MAG: hypothetical protein B6D61_08380 [Bacteroidetes bacterium 4484_249]